MMTITSLVLIVFMAVHLQAVTGQVNTPCLACICEAMSYCDVGARCVGDVCGPFKITEPYWIDAGRPTVNSQSPDDDTAYKNCALNFDCATRAVMTYLDGYEQDCNGDGVINCEDYVLIHIYGGGYGCRGVTLTEPHFSRYISCYNAVDSTYYKK